MGVVLNQAAVLLLLAVVMGGLLLKLAVHVSSGGSATQRPAVRSSAPKRVLVTGAAGFVGFHLSRVLRAQNPRHLVVGLDNYNDYYDVKLKIDRGFELHKLGVEVHDEDLCNVDFLEELFIKHKFTHVAHMAAQAGVRYSLENPLAYIHSNVECQMALLNVLRDFPHVKLVYASSSSVYGKQSPTPFRLSAATDRPGNMYAATKKTDELLGYYHCHAHNLSAVGLRFFTVYGPWGRPDMAVFKFAEKIVERKKVPMFHTTDEDPLGRDFTYVDDIIDGVMAALDYEPTECGERFNLGFGHPVSVPGLIQILEEELGIPAQVEKLPLPPTEILKTWADISTSTRLLGFDPQTDLKTGVSHFARWYLDYRKRREAERNQPSEADRWFARMFNEKLERARTHSATAAEREKCRVMRRYEQERTRDPDAHDPDIPIPKLKHKKFAFHAGLSFEGGDILTRRELPKDTKGLEQQCARSSFCVGFTTTGALKYEIPPRSLFSSGKESLYLADVDPCELKMHQCHEHAICKFIGRGLYECECRSGFVGDGTSCVPTLDRVSWRTVAVDNFVHMHSIYNTTQWKEKNKIYKFQGVRAPGGDFLYAPQLAGDTEQLARRCAHIAMCIGFTTDGYLKKEIAPRNEWVLDAATSLVVFDVNYCLLSGAGCPEHAECAPVGPADFRCACVPPFVLKHGACVKLPPLHASLLPQPDVVPPGPAQHIEPQEIPPPSR